MRVAVTGGGGFIGAHLLARLVGAGIEVTLIGPDTGRSQYVAALVAAGRARFTQCDVGFRDEPILRSALADADALVLLGQTLDRPHPPDRPASRSTRRLRQLRLGIWDSRADARA